MNYNIKMQRSQVVLRLKLFKGLFFYKNTGRTTSQSSLYFLKEAYLKIEASLNKLQYYI